MPTIDKQAAEADICLVQDTSFWTSDKTGAGKTAGAKVEHGSFRFIGITIPQGSTIITAYLTFKSRSDESGTTCNTDFFAEDVNDPSTPANYADWNGRSLTDATIPWDSLAAWTTDTEYQSPELKTIIQELVDSYDYSNEAMHIYWKNDDSDVGARRESYGGDVDPTYAPQLHIEYAPPSPLGTQAWIGRWV